MKQLLAIVCALSLLLIACGGGKDNASRPSFGSDSPNQANSSKIDCSQFRSINAKNNPKDVVLADACFQLRQMQVPVEIEEPIVDKNDLTAKVTVRARMLTCEKACVREVEKTFDAFVNVDKKWEVRNQSVDFIETEASKTQRLADEKEIRFKGIRVGVLTKQVELEDDGSIVVSLVINIAPESTFATNSVIIQLEVVLPNGEETIYMVNHYVPNTVGSHSETAVFYQKPTNQKIYFASELTAMGSKVVINCWQLGSIVRPDEITSECNPVFGEK